MYALTTFYDDCFDTIYYYHNLENALAKARKFLEAEDEFSEEEITEFLENWCADGIFDISEIEFEDEED